MQVGNLNNSYLVVHLKAAYTIKGLFEVTIPDIITADIAIDAAIKTKIRLIKKSFNTLMFFMVFVVSVYPFIT